MGESEARGKDRLDSWKTIATYLGREARTVQLWEKREGCPSTSNATRAFRQYLHSSPSWITGTTSEEAQAIPPDF